jgi:hypothetical protein
VGNNICQPCKNKDVRRRHKTKLKNDPKYRQAHNSWNCERMKQANEATRVTATRLYKRWSTKEINELRDTTKRDWELALELNRTIESVRSKRNRIGVHKPENSAGNKYPDVLKIGYL